MSEEEKVLSEPKTYFDENYEYKTHKNNILLGLIISPLIIITSIIIGCYYFDVYQFYPVAIPFLVVFVMGYILFKYFTTNFLLMMKINTNTNILTIDYFSFWTKLKQSTIEIPLYNYFYKETVKNAGAGTFKMIIVIYGEIKFEITEVITGKENFEELREDLHKYAQNKIPHLQRLW